MLEITNRIARIEAASPLPLVEKAFEVLTRIGNVHGHDMIPVAVTGNTSYDFEGGDNMKIAVRVLGALLSQIPKVVLLTGSMPAVGQDAGRYFGDSNRLYNLLPEKHNIVPTKFGNLLTTGKNFEERQLILGMAASVNVVIGGGPNTCREANVSLQSRGIVLPFACTGGAAKGMRFDVAEAIEQAIDLYEARRVALESGIVSETQYDSLCDVSQSPYRAARIVYTAIQSSIVAA